MNKIRLIAPDNDMASQRIMQGDTVVVDIMDHVDGDGVYALMTSEGLRLRKTNQIIGAPFFAPESFEIAAVIGKVVRVEVEI